MLDANDYKTSAAGIIKKGTYQELMIENVYLKSEKESFQGNALQVVPYKVVKNDREIEPSEDLFLIANEHYKSASDNNNIESCMTLKDAHGELVNEKDFQNLAYILNIKPKKASTYVQNTLILDFLAIFQKFHDLDVQSEEQL